MVPFLKEARATASLRVRRACRVPEDRLALREHFYARFPGGVGDGFGESELAFLRWEIERGALNPPRHGFSPGSRWWRAVNRSLLFDAEWAIEVWDGCDGAPSPELRALLPKHVQHWLVYMESPSAGAWYRAHNTSVVRGYFAYRRHARQECQTEQAFLCEVLERVLYAQAMAEGHPWAFGSAGSIVANPTGFAVGYLVQENDIYPNKYPVLVSTKCWIEHVLDAGIEHVRPVLFQEAALWLSEPRLARLLRDGIVSYP